jgi:hypothetical protein
MEMYNNKIYHTTPITQPATTEFAGIYFSSTLTNAHSNKIYNNMIYGIQLTNGVTAVNGFYSIGSPSSAGEPLAIYNNMISIGQNLSGTADNLPVYGIREFSLSTSRFVIFFNTVYVGGTLDSGASNSSAFRKQTSNNINLRDNIFYNVRTNAGGTGTHYGIMINNLLSTSRNYNDYYTNGSGGVFGTTTGTSAGNQTTLNDWQIATGRDTNSISKNIFFVDAPAGNLHLNGSSIGDTDLKGIPITGITTDIDGDPRNAIAPYIGADEGDIVLSISENPSSPVGFKLHQNYPNPFNPVTVIRYSLSENSFVSLKVYDVRGTEVATLVNENQNQGSYNYQLSTVNYQLSSGIYFYTLIANNIAQTKTMMLIR